MNIMNIHNLCFYLEEIGIIDETSLSLFLSLYSFMLNKTNQNNNANMLTKLSQSIFENILCAYLKKIFSVEKNYKIFSKKIVNKFKQLFVIKHFNGLIILFSILNKKLNSFKIQSFYKIYNKKEEINITNRTRNINTYNNKFYDTKINSPIIKNNGKKNSFNSLRMKYIRNNKIDNEKEEKKSEIFNKSLDFININTNRIYNNTIPSINSRNKFYGSNKNIQLEFQKKQFLSKIKREHMVKFKRDNSNSVKKLKNNNSNKNFESKLLNSFSPRINYNKNSIKYNNKEINLKKENPNDINIKAFKNTYKLNMSNDNDEESLNAYLTDFLKGNFSTKSENANFRSFLYSSPSFNHMNTRSNYTLNNKNNVGYIIKRQDKNSVKNHLSRTKIMKSNNLSLNDIHKIKKKLETLNYFNLSP